MRSETKRLSGTDRHEQGGTSNTIGAPPAPRRAWVRLPSGRRLDLLSPGPFDWTDEDLALGLARTFRWGGHSRWRLPLSVAQHSLAVLALRQRGEVLDLDRARRELLHDAAEGLLGFDCITPLKPFLGRAFAALEARLQDAVVQRYRLPAWTPEERQAHKRADLAMAVAEAVHVAGWTAAELRTTLGIIVPADVGDPLATPYAVPWEPWPPERAAERFLAELRRLQPGFAARQERAA